MVLDLTLESLVKRATDWLSQRKLTGHLRAQTIDEEVAQQAKDDLSALVLEVAALRGKVNELEHWVVEHTEDS